MRHRTVLALFSVLFCTVLHAQRPSITISPPSANVNFAVNLGTGQYPATQSTAFDITTTGPDSTWKLVMTGIDTTQGILTDSSGSPVDVNAGPLKAGKYKFTVTITGAPAANINFSTKIDIDAGKQGKASGTLSGVIGKDMPATPTPTPPPGPTPTPPPGPTPNPGPGPTPPPGPGPTPSPSSSGGTTITPWGGKAPYGLSRVVINYGSRNIKVGEIRTSPELGEYRVRLTGDGLIIARSELRLGNQLSLATYRTENPIQDFGPRVASLIPPAGVRSTTRPARNSIRAITGKAGRAGAKSQAGLRRGPSSRR